MNYFARFIYSILSCFFKKQDGSIVAITGIFVPIIAGATLFAIDHITIAQKIASLQKAADIAAISTARELHFVQKGTQKRGTTLASIAETYAKQNMPGDDIQAEAQAENDTIVKVKLALALETPLNRLFQGSRTLTAEAAAEVYGGQNICIIAVDRGNTTPGIGISEQAEIKAGDCGIYTNSRETFSIRAEGSAYVDAKFVCVAGGYEGADRNFSTHVTTDCPQIQDPLETRPFPPSGDCDSSLPNTIKDEENVNLTPGTYCGGLMIKDKASVWFTPGTYFFKDGPLIIKDKATVSGENVGLFFDDLDSHFEFKDDAEIAFSAPETGPMAGIVISARNFCPGGSGRCYRRKLRPFTITSANVRSLLGTIYLPLDDLLIDTTMPISEEAAFTILIIDNLKMRQSPSLVLNTDYAATSVPVPDGFAGKPATRLIE